MTDGQQLLAEFAQTGSETAFRELVANYVDLVYSAAVRLVEGDAHLAEDVTQTVFADLAKLARSLSRDVMLGGWLHRHTCFVASKVMRTERRRRERERQAVAMNALEDSDHSAANLASIAPVLDDAINNLGAEDRAAILLRFFEQRDFQAVGAAMGSSEEAARKRVNRALDKLESLLKRRGVAFSAAALATALSTQAVSAAPVGLAVSVSTAALVGTAASAGTTLTIVQIMSMTKLKVAIVSAVVVAGITIPMVMQHRTETKLQEMNESLRQQVERNQQLADANNHLSNQLAIALAPKLSPTNDQASEMRKLRNQVGQLRQETTDIASSKTNGPSMLSDLRKNPGMWSLIREQQKAGLGMIYKEFAKRNNLDKEQGEKLANVLADNVMDNLDRITEVLKEHKSPQEMDEVFTAQEKALEEKVQEMLTPEAFQQYKEYTKNLIGLVSAAQFKDSSMTGEKAEKDAKEKQLSDAVLAETQRTLAEAGLPADYQLVPTMNFRNFASSTEAEKNLKRLEEIFARVTANASSYLSPEEVAKLGAFRTNAIAMNRMSIELNRKMMAPGSR